MTTLNRQPDGSTIVDRHKIVTTDGEQLFNSGTGLDDKTWRDITSEVKVRGTGSTDPPWQQVNATDYWAYNFAVNDRCWMNFHIPHDYVKGTDIYFHAHWFPDGTDTNSVKWQFTYAYAHGHDQDAFDLSSVNISKEQTMQNPGIQYQHYITETAAVTITDMEPDGIIMCRIRRQGNGGTDNTDDIFLMTCDIHYQSNNRGTLNRAPDFYA